MNTNDLFELDELDMGDNIMDLEARLDERLEDIHALVGEAVENERLPENLDLGELHGMWRQRMQEGHDLSEEEIDKLLIDYKVFE